MNLNHPRVFISYAWANKELVLELAKKLVGDGIDVVMDWDLLEGQDIIKFMERSVTDTTISKVLMMCDRHYAEKADSREGGVGGETMIISPKIYKSSTETKFIPIILERKENGDVYAPAYLMSRFYIDLSNYDIYEQEYEKLLRNLYGKHVHKKPPIGKMPEWLNDECVNLSEIRTTTQKIISFASKSPEKTNFLIPKFNEDFIAAFRELVPVYGDDICIKNMRQIEAAKPLRDQFLDYVEAIIKSEQNAGNVLGDFFERFYNVAYHVEIGETYNRELSFGFGLFVVWEMFIGATAVLLHYGKFVELREMLLRTYFLKEHPYSSAMKEYGYMQFQPTFSFIEYHIKPSCENPNLYSLAAKIASERVKPPIITRMSLANADVVLYQLSEALDVNRIFPYMWFPHMYLYLGDGHFIDPQEIWRKMTSLRHCETLYPLFGVDSVSGLKDAIMLNQQSQAIGHGRGAHPVPKITHSITLEKIATFP